MRREFIFVLGFFLVGLMGFVDASVSSTAWVSFNVQIDNESIFDGEVDVLGIGERFSDWVYLTWENPDDVDFSYNLIFVDRILVGNTSEEFFNVSGLEEDREYEVSIVSVDSEGNEGVGKVVLIGAFDDGGRGSYGGDSDDGDDGEESKVRIVRSEASDFLSEGLIMGNAVINLGEPSDVGEDYDWFVLSWIVLGFLIFVSLALISVVLIMR